MQRRKFLQGGLGVLAGGLSPVGQRALAAAGDDVAAGYPSKMIRLVAPFTAGGVADTFARMQAQYLENHFKQSVVVDNVSGAGGLLAAQAVAKAAPDGLTLLAPSSGQLTILPQTTARKDFDSMRDLRMVSVCRRQDMILAVAKNSPFNSLQDVIAEAKRRPNQLTYGSIGLYSLHHICGELLNTLAGIKLKHVPYKGASEYAIDLMTNRIDMAFSTPATLTSNPTTLRGVVTISKQRSKSLPDVASAKEAGLPGYEVDSWAGIAAPAMTPQPIMRKLDAALRAMSEDKALTEKMASLDIESDYRSGEEFQPELERQFRKMTQLLETAGLKKVN